MTALDGTTIADANGNPGFPGFDSETPNVSLGYAAALLEHGVQVQNIYLSDVHGDHTAAQSGDLGPGEQTYEQQLHDYDQGFARFFRRLARDGITPQNTLFSVATDEGDHFAGSAPTPADCTGQPGHYCHYDTKSEVNVNLPGLLATKAGQHHAVRDPQRPRPGAVGHRKPAAGLGHDADAGPRHLPASHYEPLHRPAGEGRLPAGRSGRGEDPPLRQLRRVADTVADASSPARTATSAAAPPTATSRASTPPAPATPGTMAASGRTCRPSGRPTPAPGVQARGIDSDDLRRPDRQSAHAAWRSPACVTTTAVDGRVLVEELSPSALPVTLRQHRGTLLALGRVYKQLLASTGSFDMATLAASTHGLRSPSDSVYRRTERTLAALGAARDRLTRAMAASCSAPPSTTGRSTSGPRGGSSGEGPVCCGRPTASRSTTDQRPARTGRRG